MKGLFDAVSARLARSTHLSTLPLFTVGGHLFPDSTLTLKVFEQRYLDLIKQSIRDNSNFGVVHIASGAEVGAPAAPRAVGTVARIIDWDMPQLGIFSVRLRGEARFRIQSSSVTPAGLLLGEVTPLDHDADTPNAEFDACQAFLKRLLPQIEKALQLTEQRLDDPFWVGMRLTELLPLGNEIKQRMLELTSNRIRLELLYRFLRDQSLIPASA